MTDKLDAINEVARIDRALRRCKWHQYIKRKTLRAYKEMLLTIHEL